jgi:UDPglucose--hexose-1-phosphate uridylyltransferase
MHFHIEIIPRLATFAGFEFATGTIVNTMTPEAAAEFYRG